MAAGSTDFGIDGFRIDTAKPRQSRILAGVRSRHGPSAPPRRGIPNFHMFGEVATQDVDPALLVALVHRVAAAARPVLDFAFAGGDAQGIVAGKSRTAVMARMLEDDVLYKAVRKPRCACRRSSAITTWAASRCS